ncbi:Alpha/beta hydrolase of unknown function (DUF900) [Seminavis robusta]|uniref:Uncharacterized protein n=1 Tax=Seminavis robusta TaxID=568900 RepID=A0A9N8H5H4_9STRA|nr:Alpha/beta hydrolase of unknown function (DUF900) [Seminavis robusta]|eukprot:Sro85_g045520.1 Alpha/beta hydrolase of unknown function (DUF900) (1030) ;mRNA; f:116400-119620
MTDKEDSDTSRASSQSFAINPQPDVRYRPSAAAAARPTNAYQAGTDQQNRTTTNNNNNTGNNSITSSNRSNHSNKSNKKKKKKRWRWIVRKPRDLTPEQEQVFMTMKLRKLNRALTGTKTKRSRLDVFVLMAYFVLAVGVVSYSSAPMAASTTNSTENDTSTAPIIQLNLQDILIMMIYVIVVTFVTSVFRESKWITLIYWMVIYLPLCAMIVQFVVGNDDTTSLVNSVVAILLLVSEMTVLVVFLTLYKIYPKVVMSSWFRRKSRAGIFWRIKVVSDWTMTYVGSWGKRFTCKYDGETNATGLPHGFGRWLDDAYSGEVLTGTWINGFPIAPFASRHYGTGDAFKAVRVGYIMASDDEYTTTKFWPSNDKPPRIGLTSVECSISGSFYNELPLATHLSGPHWLDQEQHSVGKLCRQLTHVDDEEERVHQIVQIKSSDPRGVQVRGHVYGPTGESFHAGTDKVVVMVDKETDDGETEEQAQQPNNRPRLTPRRSLNFMPRASRQSFRPEKIIVCDNESESGDESEKPVELATVVEEDSQNLRGEESAGFSNNNNNKNDNNNSSSRVEDNSAVFSNNNAVVETFSNELFEFSSAHSREEEIPEQSAAFDPPPPSTPPFRAISNSSGMSSAYSSSSAFAFASHDIELSMGGASEHLTEQHRRLEPFRLVNASLRIQDWIPAPHKDALIFFPGYKVPLKNALEALGQFIAMTRLDSRVYPIIFGWPCGQRFSYHLASQQAATEPNYENLLALVQGLQSAGIRNVHFMSHSMGVQTLLGGFADKEDGSPSDLSLCFQLDPDFMDEEDLSSRSHSGTGAAPNGEQKMICRTVTMLNPDFPLEAFVNRAFRSVRRLCSTITIIGDRQDKALLVSQLFNGLRVYFGYDQPEVLQPRPSRDCASHSEREVYQGKHRFLQQVIGLSIESLYFPSDIDKDNVNDALLFKERAPVIVCTDGDDEEQVQDRAWLDVDVIDTTGLDTNIAGIRHSGFNLNPILLKDLEELIATGRRAVSRATLLYREGNNFSYCHAPSYVAM